MPKSIRIGYTSKFSKSLNSLPIAIQSAVVKKDAIFRLDPFDARLRTHQLKGKLEDYWAYSVNYRYRIIFKFISDLEVVYIDVGTHEVYR